MRPVFTVAALTFGFLAACASVNYGTTKPGHFSGRLAVVWVGPTGSNGGDGRFLYIPDENDPLTFTRPEAPRAPGMAKFDRIVAGPMYTDGGSVPRLAQVFRGFSPWNYGPAYIVHDWLFTARQCLNDKNPDPVYGQVEGMAFQTSAEILAEAIRTLEDMHLVARDDVSASAITLAVSSPFSAGRWTVKGACDPVRPDDVGYLRAVQEVRNRSAVGVMKASRMVRLPDGERLAGPEVKVVAYLSY